MNKGGHFTHGKRISRFKTVTGAAVTARPTDIMLISMEHGQGGKVPWIYCEDGTMVNVAYCEMVKLHTEEDDSVIERPPTGIVT